MNVGQMERDPEVEGKINVTATSSETGVVVSG